MSGETPAAAKRRRERLRREHEAHLQSQRVAWLDALEKRGLNADCPAEEWDAVAALCGGDAVVRLAREVEDLVRRCRRTVERAFVFGAFTHPVDPHQDSDASARIARRLHRLISKEGPTLTRASVLVEASEEDDELYKRLPAAEQARWRVALMRYLDLVARTLPFVPRDDDELAQLWEDPPYDASNAELVRVLDALRALPFSLSTLPSDDLEMIRRLWVRTRPGKKKRGEGSKWKVLAAVLRASWGCEATHRALASEWKRNAPLTLAFKRRK